MAGKKGAGENSKKAAGQARKAEAAASKKAAEQAKVSAQEDAEWQKGSKSNKKAEEAAARAAEQARKKAEKDALLKAEEASLPSKPKGAGAKKAEKKSAGPGARGGGGGGLDAALAGLDAPAAASKKAPALNATGIDDALDALTLTSASKDAVDRHPERRFKAAYAAYEERRLEEMKDEKGLRRNQKIEQIRKEFEKHPDNPFNQVTAKYNSTKEEIEAARQAEREKVEKRLAAEK